MADYQGMKQIEMPPYEELDSSVDKPARIQEAKEQMSYIDSLKALYKDLTDKKEKKRIKRKLDKMTRQAREDKAGSYLTTRKAKERPLKQAGDYHKKD